MNIARLFIVLITLLANAVAGQSLVASQGNETTFTSELTGLVIDIGNSGEGAIIPESHSIRQDDDFRQEDILIRRGAAHIFLSFLEEDVNTITWEMRSLKEQAPNYLRYEILAADVGRDRSWTLYRGTYMLQYTEVTYTEFEERAFGEFHYSFVIYTSQESLLDDLQWVRENVFVDDSPVLFQEDYSHLNMAFAGTGDREPRVATAWGTDVEDWGDSGLESAQSWTGPLSGSQVTWDSAWVFPFQKDSGININREEEREQVVLITPDFAGDAILIFEPSREGLATPEDWLNRWTSEEWLADREPTLHVRPSETVLTANTAGVVLEGTARYGEPVTLVYNAYVASDGFIIITIVRSSPENIGTVYQEFLADVRVDGQMAPVAWSLEDIQALPVD